MASPQEFAAQYGSVAADIGKKLGVDPTIVLGQLGLETGWGKSIIPGTNNLGNIKDFSGQGTMATDNATGSRDAYRTYADPAAFGNDFAGLIQRRYAGALGAGDDAAKYASAMKAGGYAEDPDYAAKLVGATNLVRKSGGILDRIAQAVLPSADAAPAPVAKPWKDVAASPAFQALTPDQQQAAQTQYFNQVVAPRVPAGQADAARAQFMKQYGSSAAPAKIAGQLQAGNIDLNARPIVHNADGTISTVRSMSFQDEKGGPEILIPTVAADGSGILSDDDAIEQYRRTGQFLGKFDTPENATAYAEQLHKDQEKLYADKGNGGAATSRGTDGVLRVDMGGTNPTPGAIQKTGQQAATEAAGAADTNDSPSAGANFARGLYQGVTDLPAGLGQQAAHEGLSTLRSVDSLLGTHLADQANPKVQGLDQEAIQREADYQAATPGSTAAGVGRVLGNLAPAIATGSSVITGGARAAGGLARALGANSGIEGAASLGGASAGSSLLGGAYAAATPISTPGDYDAQKADQTRLGLEVGAAIPGASRAVGAVARGAGSTVRNLIEPFSEAGQGRIADRLIRQASTGGPTNILAQELVPGSVPTLAEATGNPGIATLQRTIRDLNPAPFVQREADNAAARTAAFSDAAGDASKLDFFRADRAATASNLYGQAIANWTGQLTPWLKGQITQLLKRPSIDDASKVAQRWAIERGEKPLAEGSLQALHDVKTALDDKIARAVQQGEGGEAKALQATKDMLLTVMEKMSPEYAQARMTYASMSQPVNAMEALQGLRLTDQYGNITLQKVQTALRNLQDQIAAPGANAAKSIEAHQMATLEAIRDDLLRATNTGLGRSAGSSTAQNIAVQNLLTDALPGRMGSRVAQSALGGVAKRLGGVVYGGTDEQIRNRLVERLLDPTAGGAALTQPVTQGPGTNLLLQRAAPYLNTAGTLAPVNFLANRR